MKTSLFEIARRQQGIILFLIFLLHYLPFYTPASIVFIIWGLLEGRILRADPDFPAHDPAALEQR